VQIYPAIDLMDGQAVRLSQGKRESKQVYSDNPAALVAGFAAEGARRLHVVDLDAAFSKGVQNNRAVIRRIVEAAGDKMEVEVGGGIRSTEDCEALFSIGVRYAVLGTLAIKDPVLGARLCAQYPGAIIVAVDAWEGRVAVEGWTEDSGKSAVDIGKEYARAGAAAILYTDIGRDGMRTGPNIEATLKLGQAIAPCPVIASGGVARLSDLDNVIKTGGIGVIIGKALYEGEFTVAQAVSRLRELQGSGN